jgi:hypothetical protein
VLGPELTEADGCRASAATLRLASSSSPRYEGSREAGGGVGSVAEMGWGGPGLGGMRGGGGGSVLERDGYAAEEEEGSDDRCGGGDPDLV